MDSITLSVSSVYDLNPPPHSSFPVVELQEDDQPHLQLFLSPHHASASVSSDHTFLNIPTQDQDQSHYHDHEVDKYVSHSRWSNHHQLLTSSSFQATLVDEGEGGDYEEGRSGEGSSSVNQWMPSKMKLMQKMINSNFPSETNNKPLKLTQNKFQDHQQYQTSKNTSNTSIRACADCNTTTTPLWRSGPRGPKSLCNACGIRQRKARRAMAEGAMANGTAVAMETSISSKTKVHNKEKKSRTGLAAQAKKLCKPPDPPHQGSKNLCFKNLALSLSKNSALQRVFSRDVEEAAILLVELSCGFIHS